MLEQEIKTTSKLLSKRFWFGGKMEYPWLHRKALTSRQNFFKLQSMGKLNPNNVKKGDRVIFYRRQANAETTDEWEPVSDVRFVVEVLTNPNKKGCFDGKVLVADGLRSDIGSTECGFFAPCWIQISIDEVRVQARKLIDEANKLIFQVEKALPMDSATRREGYKARIQLGIFSDLLRHDEDLGIIS